MSNTDRAYEDLMDEFSNLVEAMEDVFSAAAEDGGEKLIELRGQAEASLKKAKARLGAMEKDRGRQGAQDRVGLRRLRPREPVDRDRGGRGRRPAARPADRT
jgi:ElaB/YqjD/DUF883 family membrane-anchored ribosome-binding protein